MDSAVADKQSAIAWYTVPGGAVCLAIIEVWGAPGERHTSIRWVPDRAYPGNQIHPMISLLEVMAHAADGQIAMPRSKKRSPFAIGQRWACDRREKEKASFDFVIVGRGHNDRHKLCMIEPWTSADRVSMPAFRNRELNDPIVAEYSHNHILKHAKRVLGKDETATLP